MSIFDDPVLLHRELQRIGSTGTGRQVFDRDKLSEPPAPDPYTCTPEPEEDTGTRMTHAELDKAEDELAAKYGRTKVRDMIYLAHGQATLGRSENERHAVLGQVVLALRNHEREVPGHKVAGLRDTVLALAAQQGTVMTGPAGDEEVRLSAAPAAGLTQETRAMGLAAGQDGADDIAARNPDIFLARHPSKSGVLIDSKTRAHAAEFQDDPVDRDQPAGKGVHAEVARYIKMREDMFGGESCKAGSHGSRSYGPKPYRPPGASGKPQSSR
jgi:hypothetical protein